MNDYDRERILCSHKQMHYVQMDALVLLSDYDGYFLFWMNIFFAIPCNSFFFLDEYIFGHTG